MMINVWVNISKGLDTFSNVEEVQQRIDVNWLPSLRGSQPLTVLPLSTSTKTLRPSIFLPSACLYAAVREKSSSLVFPHTYTLSLLRILTPDWRWPAYTNLPHTYTKLTYWLLRHNLKLTLESHDKSSSKIRYEYFRQLQQILGQVAAMNKSTYQATSKLGKILRESNR